MVIEVVEEKLGSIAAAPHSLLRVVSLSTFVVVSLQRFRKLGRPLVRGSGRSTPENSTMELVISEDPDTARFIPKGPVHGDGIAVQIKPIARLQKSIAETF